MNDGLPSEYEVSRVSVSVCSEAGVIMMKVLGTARRTVLAASQKGGRATQHRVCAS